MQFTAFPGTCTKCAALLRPLPLLSCRLISPVKSRAEQIRAHTLLGDELHPWSSKRTDSQLSECRLCGYKPLPATVFASWLRGVPLPDWGLMLSQIVIKYPAWCTILDSHHTRTLHTLAHTRTTRHIKILAPNKQRTRNIFRRLLASLIASNLNNISLRFYL